jgi:DNA-binding beta-propeller fold protein YncE
MTLSIRGDNHDIVRIITDDKHVPIIVYKDFNLNDKSISSVINSDMPGVYYVATSGDKLYYTNGNTHFVTCCDLHGTTQWEFKNELVLRSPLGVFVDNDGNVFVVGYNSDNVVVISPDGQRSATYKMY